MLFCFQQPAPNHAAHADTISLRRNYFLGLLKFTTCLIRKHFVNSTQVTCIKLVLISKLNFSHLKDNNSLAEFVFNIVSK